MERENKFRCAPPGVDAAVEQLDKGDLPGGDAELFRSESREKRQPHFR